MQTTVKRYGMSMMVASGVTAGLVLIMQYAIQNDGVTETSVKHIPITEIVRLLDDRPVETAPPKVKKPEPPIVPPVVNRIVPEFVHNGGGFAPVANPVVKHTPTVGHSRGEGDILPIMVVAPEYPQRQLSRGVEGWVLVEFTVDELGRVVEPRVVEAYPNQGFNQSALRAVLRYKYKPRVMNGEAIRVDGVRQRIVFNLSV